MRPYGIPKAVVKGYDKESMLATGKIGNNRSRVRQVWKGRARQELKRDLGDLLEEVEDDSSCSS